MITSTVWNSARCTQPFAGGSFQSMRSKSGLSILRALVCLHLPRRGRSSSPGLQSLLYQVSSLILGLPNLIRSSRASLHTPALPIGPVCVKRKWSKQPSWQIICHSAGTLRDNTVATTTRQRYCSALQSFHFFCQAHRLGVLDEGFALDELLAEYIEHLRAEGPSFSLAIVRPAVLAAQPLWFLCVVALSDNFATDEVPDRAPPLSEQLLQFFVDSFSTLMSPRWLWHWKLRLMAF